MIGVPAMLASQRALFSDILDYAGLFPPAELPLDTSIRNYVRYRAEPQAWMLARFICPAERLSELGPYVREHFRRESPLRIAVLGRDGSTADVFLDNLDRDLDAIVRFQETHGPAVAAECFETRLPVTLSSEAAKTPERLLALAADVFVSHGLAPLARFFELRADADWPAAANVLAELNRRSAAELPRTAARRGANGLKLRCGGLNPAAIPSVAQVATAIRASLEAQIPLKFTAGLHHPTRRVDPGLGVRVHGFINVFAAGILGATLGLEHPDLMAIIDEEDIHQFTFSDDFLAWSDAEATVSEIVHARHNHVISFGSCSFDEPRDDLRELGYI
jgi:hypothetical protein